MWGSTRFNNIESKGKNISLICFLGIYVAIWGTNRIDFLNQDLIVFSISSVLWLPEIINSIVFGISKLPILLILSLTFMQLSIVSIFVYIVIIDSHKNNGLLLL